GLDHANRLMSESERELLIKELRDSQEKRLIADAKRAERPEKIVTEKIARTVQDAQVFKPKDLVQHVTKNYSVAHLHPYVNMRTLIGHHLGYKGNVEKALIEKEDRA
ncbi:hypothetical protein D7X33_27825, partial [Butyricicoccus sp. 1XD8-22]